MTLDAESVFAEERKKILCSCLRRVDIMITTL